MTGRRAERHSTGRTLYLGAVSGLVGGLVWFALDTLTRGAAMGPAFFAEVALKFTFLLLPLFYYGLTGLVAGLLFSGLLAAASRGGRGGIAATLPPWFPFLAGWCAFLLLAGYIGWERNGLRIARPGGALQLAGIVFLAFVPVFVALAAGAVAWRRPFLRPLVPLVAAAPLLLSGWALRPRGEEDGAPPAVAPARPGPEGSAPNVLLITIDTLRRDHLGCYGNGDVRTPEIDRLAGEGVLFTRCVAQAPITLPSHSSILTGTYPPRHGVRDNGFYRLEAEAYSLAEQLGEAGYATAAFVSAFPLDSSFGLDQGFDLYDDRIMDRNAFFFSRVARFYTLAPALEWVGLYRPVVIAERKAGRTTTQVLRWLDGAGARPFFLWVHLFDPHNPLDPPPEYEAMYVSDALRERVGPPARREEIRSTRDFTVYAGDSPEAEYMRALYKAEVTYTDEHVGRILRRLDDLGLADRTLVVLTADHGQSLYEHDFVGHSGALYAQTVDIPLIVRHPSLPASGRVDGLVQEVDIAPTILDFVGIDVPEEIQGRSLLPMIPGGEGEEPAPPAYLETLHAARGPERQRGLILGGWKLIRSEDGSFVRLYDVANDPEERVDLAGLEAARVEAMTAALDELAGRLGAGVEKERIPVDPGTREILKSLGYVW